jgi:hypothetical protein
VFNFNQDGLDNYRLENKLQASQQQKQQLVFQQASGKTLADPKLIASNAMTMLLEQHQI